MFVSMVEASISTSTQERSGCSSMWIVPENTPNRPRTLASIMCLLMNERPVDRMEEAGLVRRESCPADRRGTFAVLTSTGVTALEAATPVFLDGFERHVARHLSDADVRALQAALGKVLEAHGKPASLECRSPLESDSTVREEHRTPDQRTRASRN